MTTMLVWLLISASDGVYNRGTLTNVGMFQSASQCEDVLKNLPAKQTLSAKCFQAEILVPK